MMPKKEENRRGVWMYTRQFGCKSKWNRWKRMFWSVVDYWPVLQDNNNLFGWFYYNFRNIKDQTKSIFYYIASRYGIWILMFNNSQMDIGDVTNIKLMHTQKMVKEMAKISSHSGPASTEIVTEKLLFFFQTTKSQKEMSKTKWKTPLTNDKNNICIRIYYYERLRVCVCVFSSE